jgi:hypothetical protein
MVMAAVEPRHRRVEPQLPSFEPAEDLAGSTSTEDEAMIRRRSLLFVSLLSLAGCGAETMPSEPMMDAPVSLSKTARGGRAGALGVVYVRSQDRYYDTFVSAETLPMSGRFQKLEDGETEFGPGDPGYLGGRWWVDVNGDDIQDAGDVYLLCPLLPPGRVSP